MPGSRAPSSQASDAVLSADWVEQASAAASSYRSDADQVPGRPPRPPPGDGGPSHRIISRMTPSLAPAAQDSAAAHARSSPARSSASAPGQRRSGPVSSSMSSARRPDGGGRGRVRGAAAGEQGQPRVAARPAGAGAGPRRAAARVAVGAFALAVPLPWLPVHLRPRSMVIM